MSLLEPGIAGPTVCPVCDGRGVIRNISARLGPEAPIGIAYQEITCQRCEGTGLPTPPPSVNGSGEGTE